MNDNTKITNTPVLPCHLSVMECMLVWEFILLSRRQHAETTLTETLVHDNELRILTGKRRATLEAQCDLAEWLLQSSHMPVPSAKPVIKRENLAGNDRFVLAALLRLTENRIQSLSHLIRSQITNRALRRIGKQWLSEEADLLAQFASYAGILACNTSPLA